MSRGKVGNSAGVMVEGDEGRVTNGEDLQEEAKNHLPELLPDPSVECTS